MLNDTGALKLDSHEYLESTARIWHSNSPAASGASNGRSQRDDRNAARRPSGGRAAGWRSAGHGLTQTEPKVAISHKAGSSGLEAGTRRIRLWKGSTLR